MLSLVEKQAFGSPPFVPVVFQTATNAPFETASTSAGFSPGPLGAFSPGPCYGPGQKGSSLLQPADRPLVTVRGSNRG